MKYSPGPVGEMDYLLLHSLFLGVTSEGSARPHVSFRPQIKYVAI